MSVPATIDQPLQLSLFDPPPAGIAPATAPPPSQPPVQPTVQPLPLPAFDHPRPSRRIVLLDRQVQYHLRRSARRSIGFVIDDEGLGVSAPRWVSNADIEAALREKAAWILRKLQERREQAQRTQSERIAWRDGAELHFLGEPVIVVIDPRATGAVLHTGAESLPGVPHLTLHIGLPQDAQPAQIRDVVQSWLQRQALRIFDERCRHFAQRLGVRVTRLALSSAQTRWGSASADGSVRLHWRLVHFRLATIDYVIAHELAHLREMNHSAAFWNVVRSVMPDYENHRQHLRTASLPGF
jgi:predicted metal-dependent hydrolase